MLDDFAAPKQGRVEFDYNVISWPWDKVPGWDFFEPYLDRTNPDGRKIPLWIFGHVHDYQRRDGAGHVAEAAPPLLLIAGGGAALDSGPGGYQWQPDGWPGPFLSSAHHHVKLSVTSTSISVEVRGSPSEAQPFTVIDSFSVPLNKEPSAGSCRGALQRVPLECSLP